MLEMTMLNNLKELIQHQASSIHILSIELEIIFTFAYASLQSVKNSEIDLENSQHFLMNVQLIGFYLGLKRL
jgi:hypothetical protein